MTTPLGVSATAPSAALQHTPTASLLPQRAGNFDTVLEALEYAAGGATGLNFHSVRGELIEALRYGALAEQSRRLARILLGRGFAPGERVAIVAETQPDFVRIFFACQYAGLVPVPLPLPVAFGGRAGYVSHVRRLVAEANAVALFAGPALLEWLAPLGEDGQVRLCSTVASIAGDQLPPVALPVIGPESIAYLQFSSGSTRFPLGVAVRQRALMANIAGILLHGLQINPTDRAVSWLPLYHDMGMVGFLLAPMAGQVTVDLLATSDFARRPMLWLQMIAARRATISYSPSFGYDLCTRRGLGTGVKPPDLSCWRIAGIGGDMIRPPVLTGFARAFADTGFDASAFRPSYGMAEATLAISFAPPGQGFEIDHIDLDRLEQAGLAVPPGVVPHAGRPARVRDVVLCGTPLPGHELAVRDLHGRLVADRQVGRVFVRGPSLMQGYDSRPVETAAVLSADGWLDTGDLGYLLDGALVITGRAKDLIIINGRNIWPQDLEWTIEQRVPEIRTGNVAAFSVEEDGQEVLILAAEPRSMPVNGQRETLMHFIGSTVRAEHGLEGRVVLLPANSLPYTSSGKLSRSATRQRYLAGMLEPQALIA